MRNVLLSLALAIGLLNGPAWAQVEIPETPAGTALEAWLDAFNSGNRSEIQAFVDRYGWPQPIDGIVSFSTMTGGFDLLGIERSDAQSIEFIVQERARDTRALGRLALSVDPFRITEATLRAIPPGSEIAGFEIDAAMRDDVIRGVNDKLREFYVYEDSAEAMAEALERRRRGGEYDAITNGSTFAELLTTHLREVSNDLHLRVNFSPVATPPPPTNAEPSPEARERYREQMANVNCGFEKVEVLPGNVGYLKFNMFAEPTVCGPTATAAMNFLGNVRALIFDMRDNLGGSPAMVAYVTSYLFDTPTHLNDLYERAEDTTRQWWTLPHVAGRRLAEQPVYVLTSQRTFSGGEEFTYNLKSLGRATVVGEITGGGAHPVRGVWVNEQFSVGVPFARAINPITKTNWEGTGVQPDIEVPADQALDKARELIEAN